MAAELPSYKQPIAEILDSSKPLVNSKLAYLSDLSGDGLEFLKQAWVEAEAIRRHQVISHLIHLCEADLKLDFSSTFAFCLRDADETVRTQAIAGLEAEENHIFVSPLVETLKQDSSAKVRAAAAMALGKFALLGKWGKLSPHCTDQVCRALLEVLDNKREAVEVQRRALEAIAPLNLPRLKEFIEAAYHSNDVKLEASAICAMGRSCDSVWLTTLLAELSSNQAEIRYEAANACGELGAEEASSHLIELTEDEDACVQEAAIRALGEIGGEEARQTLNKLAGDREPRIRQAAKSALKELRFFAKTLYL